jgi:predicted enzyme related to lactoylglutathione lyase
MSERDGYEPGVPCWIASVHADPEQAVDFYTRLFGWEAANTMPPNAPGRYYVCTLRGRDVAAIGTRRGGEAPSVAAWGTYIWVESADDAVRKVVDAGGSLLVEPFDLLDAGRLGVVADPAGAVFSVWQPWAHRGAQVVNEPGAWSMSVLNSPDTERAKEFYGAVFGWEPEAMDETVTMWRLPGFVGGEPQQPVPRDVVAVLIPLTDPDTVTPHWNVDFWVGDLDATVEAAPRLGGTVVVPPYEVPGTPLRQAVLADPQSASFSVTQVMIADRN